MLQSGGAVVGQKLLCLKIGEKAYHCIPVYIRTQNAHDRLYGILPHHAPPLSLFSMKKRNENKGLIVVGQVWRCPTTTRLSSIG